MRKLLILGALLGIAAAAPRPVEAHTKARAIKEIVRIRGTLPSDTAGCADGAVSVLALNKTIRLCGADVRRIAVSTPEIAEQQPLPSRFDLQGERSLLARLTAAGAGNRVILLGEWRPGRRDLFLFAIDVCPCGDNGTADDDR
jgi:hypothetical protein